MKRGPITVVIGRGSELDLALSALEDLDLRLRVIPTLQEAGWALLGTARPQVSAVLVSLAETAREGLDLIRSLRAAPGLATVPIAAWAPAESAGILTEAYRAGASSGVLLQGTDDDAVRLARMIHYWAAANEPFSHEALV